MDIGTTRSGPCLVIVVRRFFAVVGVSCSIAPLETGVLWREEYILGKGRLLLNTFNIDSIDAFSG